MWAYLTCGMTLNRLFILKTLQYRSAKQSQAKFVSGKTHFPISQTSLITAFLLTHLSFDLAQFLNKVIWAKLKSNWIPAWKLLFSKVEFISDKWASSEGIFKLIEYDCMSMKKKTKTQKESVMLRLLFLLV